MSCKHRDVQAAKRLLESWAGVSPQTGKILNYPDVGCTALFWMSVVFAVLKLTGELDMSWHGVLTPFYIMLIFNVLLAVLAMFWYFVRR